MRQRDFTQPRNPRSKKPQRRCAMYLARLSRSPEIISTPCRLTRASFTCGSPFSCTRSQKEGGAARIKVRLLGLGRHVRKGICKGRYSFELGRKRALRYLRLICGERVYFFPRCSPSVFTGPCSPSLSAQRGNAVSRKVSSVVRLLQRCCRSRCNRSVVLFTDESGCCHTERAEGKKGVEE